MGLVNTVKQHWKEAALTLALLGSGIASVDAKTQEIDQLNPTAPTEKTSETNPNKVNKHALLFCADSYKDFQIVDSAVGGGTKNTYLISIANIYNSLREQGFKAENIDLVYFDGKPDFTEKKDSDLIAKLKDEKGTEIASEIATKESLIEKINKLKNETQNRDEIFVYMTGHGTKDYAKGDIYFEISPTEEWGMYERIYPEELVQLLKQIPSENVDAVLDFCYSGKLGAELAKQGIDAYTATDSTTFSMRSRDSQFGRDLMNAKINLEADSDKNGTISYEEAFAFSEAKRLPSLEKHKEAGHYAKLKMQPGQIYKAK